MGKQYRTLAPPEFLDAVEAHARAVAADDAGAASCVSEMASTAHAAALARINSLRPLKHYSVIARARLGQHYIVKVRFVGAGGESVTLQNRWHKQDSGRWMIVEVEDIGLRPPWVKPEKPTVIAHA